MLTIDKQRTYLQVYIHGEIFPLWGEVTVKVLPVFFNALFIVQTAFFCVCFNQKPNMIRPKISATSLAATGRVFKRKREGLVVALNNELPSPAGARWLLHSGLCIGIVIVLPNKLVFCSGGDRK